LYWAQLIPWDEICGIYYKQAGRASTGREPLNPRIVLGSLIIKYLCHLDDREVVEQISENIYMQYFLGYSSFVNEKPFDASLFVELRKRIGMDVVNSINERIVALKTHFESKEASEPEGNVPPKDDSPPPSNTGGDDLPEPPSNQQRKGHLRCHGLSAGHRLSDRFGFAFGCPPKVGGTDRYSV
jgi:hypothetical protein